MSNKTFADFGAFREWANLESGDKLTFPFGSSQGWSVVVTDLGVEIHSPFYRVAAGGAYGAAMIYGHTFLYGSGVEASGIIEFGLNDLQEVAIVNRRRLTSADKFDESTHALVDVIIAQPDRALESVVVVIHGSAVNQAQNMTEGEVLALYERVRDALELQAVRALLRWLDA